MNFFKSVVAVLLLSSFVSSALADVIVVRATTVESIEVKKVKGKFGETQFHYKLTSSSKATEYDECILEGVVNSLNFGLEPVLAEQTMSRKEKTVQLILSPGMIDNRDGSGQAIMPLEPSLISRIFRAKSDEPGKPAFDVYLANAEAEITEAELGLVAEAMKFLASQRLNGISSERLKVSVEIDAETKARRYTMEVLPEKKEAPKKPAPKAEFVGPTSFARN